MADSLEDLVIDFIARNLSHFTILVDSSVTANSSPQHKSVKPQTPEHNISQTLSASSSLTACGTCQNKILHFQDSDFVLPEILSEKLLCALDQYGLLSDEKFSLFGAESTNLVHVRVHNTPGLTQRSLARLRGHRLRSLEITNLKEVSTNTILGCIGDSCWRCLEQLNVSGVSLLCDKLPVVVGLSRFKNLRFLNVSCSEFDSKCLGVVCDDLQHLSGLDISRTEVNDLTPLLKLQMRLRALHLYRVRPSSAEKFLDVLSRLRCLRTLDVSDDHVVNRLSRPSSRDRLEDLFHSPNFLPLIQRLDLSGNKMGLVVEDTRMFLNNHPRLEFLGLAMNDDECSCSPPELFGTEEEGVIYPNLAISGENSEPAMMENLRRYADRAPYMQRTLYHLFLHTNIMEQPTEHFLKLVFPSMRLHPTNLSVQLAASAVLYNLTKGPHCESLTRRSLNNAVHLTMAAMEGFPKHAQLQKNCLLTLCSDTVLEHANFDRCRCCRLVFESLCTNRDAHMTRMAAAIVSILAAKVDTRELRELARERRFIRRLLSIVREKTQVLRQAAGVSPVPQADVGAAAPRDRGQEPAAVAANGAAVAPVAQPPVQVMQVDTAMRFTLSALWNLTDECPEASTVFVEEGGLFIYEEVFQVFEGEDSEDKVNVFTKMLGLLNNVAEVEHIRRTLLCPQFVRRLASLLSHSSINISYFAAGILSHLLCVPEIIWLQESPNNLEECLHKLEVAVLDWSAPEADMVAYRSFKPFAPLLRQKNHPEVHLWALWAIHHVCQRDKNRYLPYLMEECNCSNSDYYGRVIDLIYELVPGSESAHNCATDVQCVCITSKNPSTRLHALANSIVFLANSYSYV